MWAELFFHDPTVYEWYIKISQLFLQTIKASLKDADFQNNLSNGNII